MIEEQLIEKTQNWNVKQWRDYLFQNGVMDIETFRQKCYDIVDEIIASKYGTEDM